MRSINLFGVQQICRNTIAVEQVKISSQFLMISNSIHYLNLRVFTLQAMAAIPYIDSETVQQNLDRVRTYFELLNMPFEVSKKEIVFLLVSSFGFLSIIMSRIPNETQMFT